MDNASGPVIILAGGKSRRFGRDKASAVLGNRTLPQHAIDACEGVTSRILVVVANGQELPAFTSKAPIEVLSDAYPETGPLGGICTGLEALSLNATGPEQHALVVACDMPLLQPALLRELQRLAVGVQAVAPVHGDQPEPLCAAYATSCVPAAQALLAGGQYAAQGLLKTVETHYVAPEHWRTFDPDGLSFLNVNRESDLDSVRRIVESLP